MDQQSLVRLRCRYLFTAAGPPRRDAVVSLAKGRIVAIEAPRSDDNAIELGNAAILPGLVNAHTHLEFSDLKSPLGSPGMPFADWIRAVVAYRRSRTDAEREAASIKGLSECGRFGTTTVGEIATAGWPVEAFSAAAAGTLEATVFLESIGLRTARLPSALEAAKEHLALAAQRGIRVGLSPHAPYSVQRELMRRLAALSAIANVPLAIHLAELPDELDLLQTGRGRLRDLLVEFDAWDDGAISIGSTPLDYLRLLAVAPRTLVIHGNYLSNEEIAFVGAHARRMSVVYCPRTHTYFGHPPYPLAKLLQAGAVVALGTDSRASNPDLSLLEEMREVLARHAIAPEKILEMATLSGAKALGRDEDVGSIAPGKRADLAIVRLLDAATADPYELLFDPRSFVETTIHCGSVVAGKSLSPERI